MARLPWQRGVAPARSKVIALSSVVTDASSAWKATPLPLTLADVNGGTSKRQGRCVLLAVVTCVLMGAVELFLEAAPQRVDGLSAPEVGLVLTLGEFLGASIVAYLIGGSFSDAALTSSSPNASSWVSYVVLPNLLFIGSGFANVAVSWVEFPVKLVIKSSKLIPTMTLSALVGNSRRFSAQEYMAAAFLCLGNAVFSCNSGRSGAPPEMVFLGVSMLLCAIAADATAVNAQQWLMQKEHMAPETLMLRQNSVSAVVCSVFMMLTVGFRRYALAVLACPVILGYAAAVGFATALAIWANLHLIREAGSVVQVCVSMFRKLLAIVVSYALFPKPFCRLHFVALVLVLVGVLLAAPRRSSRMGQSTSIPASRLETLCRETRPGISEAIP